MPPLSVLIKPASSACNMNCSYCFYKDVAANRERGFAGYMTMDTLEKLIASALDYADRDCTFLFQGGEPTLAGLGFYRAVLELERKYAKKMSGYSTLSRRTDIILMSSGRSFWRLMVSWSACLWTDRLMYTTAAERTWQAKILSIGS